ncbi:hypothetical protein [uncultured Polaribacter sp.]|uniref:hypothetical protein n=1 Tax=uncultured Polaribacter sp. TaxID=174711 RepID=UPI00261C7825|nr:hypothetical protein [uncultured Polaribacter sp.]
MKKNTLILLLFITYYSNAQFKATGYFDKEIGISYAFNNKLQTELRINDNLGIDFNTELSLLYKFVNKSNYNFNTGLGVSFFPFTGADLQSVYLPVQLEIFPVQNNKNLALVLESAYHLDDFENGLRNTVGIRYIFNK